MKSSSDPAYIGAIPPNHDGSLPSDHRFETRHQRPSEMIGGVCVRWIHQQRYRVSWGILVGISSLEPHCVVMNASVYHHPTPRVDMPGPRGTQNPAQRDSAREERPEPLTRSQNPQPGPAALLKRLSIHTTVIVRIQGCGSVLAVPHSMAATNHGHIVGARLVA